MIGSVLASSGFRGAAAAGNFYYVDSVNGDDANDGTLTEPFQTFAGLPTLVEGDTIVLAGGSVWYETLTIPVDNVTVIAFGDVIIDGSDTLSSGGWADSTDRSDANTNVYSRQITTESTGVVSWVNAFEDGAHLRYVTSVANCQSTAGSYYVSNHLSATPTLYIHPVNSDDPASNGSEYRYTRRYFCVDALSADNFTMQGVTTRRQLHESGSTVTGRSAVLRNCNFDQGSKHNVYFKDGSLLEDCDAADAHYNSDTSTYVYNEDTPASLGVTLRRCSASMPALPSLGNYKGVSGHRNGASGDFGTLTFEDCTFTNLYQAWANLGNAPIVNISGGTVTDCKGLINPAGGQVITVSDLSSDCTPGLGSFGFANINLSNGADVSFTDCSLIADSPQTALIFVNASNATLRLLRTYMRTTLAAVCIRFQTSVTGNTWEMDECILDASAQQVIVSATSDVPDFTGDNNCYMRTGQAQQFACIWNGTTHNTIAPWQAATGQDANSTVGSCS